MQVIKFPSEDNWDELLQRPVIETASLEKQVKSVLEKVKKNGDKAVSRYTEKFDKVKLEQFAVPDEEIIEAEKLLSKNLKKAIRKATDNIEKFHAAQKNPVEKMETMPGVSCWRKSVGIEKVGLYIPGGSAPLFSTVLMLGIPAKLAGCKEVVLCTPPSSEGRVNPAILYAASLAGITQIFKIGGVQAIGAMAYGTETVPKVYKIFGPGNQYVTCAKQLVTKDKVAIDMPAGPSEMVLFADETAQPEYVAADLLSQAEHGKDSQVILFTTHEEMIEGVQNAVKKQLKKLSRKDIAEASLENSRIILLGNREDTLKMINKYAPEHLILSCKKEEEVAEKVINAGSVFLGNYSPESVGDYASGTNHTLPTNGYAIAYSGVSLDSFVKKITFQKLSKKGLKNIGDIVEEMAAAEGLDAHKNAVAIRKK
ncbi:MAG TPA: histidinol dehydrogenase [Chitinophagaceae bacterium]|nr:histidinol dehydrogenase [Chitinophagaceae bacterium]